MSERIFVMNFFFRALPVFQVTSSVVLPRVTTTDVGIAPNSMFFILKALWLMLYLHLSQIILLAAEVYCPVMSFGCIIFPFRVTTNFIAVIVSAEDQCA